MSMSAVITVEKIFMITFVLYISNANEFNPAEKYVHMTVLINALSV